MDKHAGALEQHAFIDLDMSENVSWINAFSVPSNAAFDAKSRRQIVQHRYLLMHVGAILSCA